MEGTREYGGEERGWLDESPLYYFCQQPNTQTQQINNLTAFHALGVCVSRVVESVCVGR